MVVRLPGSQLRRSGFAGLRLTAEEYFALPEDGNRYELIDGVLTMSPSASADHQRVSKQIYDQLNPFVTNRGLGEVFYEIDVQFGQSLDGRDIVYRPDVICFLGPASREIGGRFDIVPDVVVEVVSPESTSRDWETKFADYERFGVREYWLIDPIEERMTFFRLRDGRYFEAPSLPDFYESAIVPGFQLDLTKVRAAFRAIK